MAQRALPAAAAPIVVVALVVAAGCAGSLEPEELTAVPHPAEHDLAVDENVDGEAVGSPGAEAEQASSTPAEDREATGHGLPADPGAPRPDDTRRFLLERRTDEVVEDDHLLLDLDGDEGSDLVLAMVTEDRSAVVEVAHWVAGSYEVADRLSVGPADGLGRLRVGRWDEERAILLPLHQAGAPRVAAWHLDADGRLRAPEACPLSGPRSMRLATGGTTELACAVTRAVEPGVLVWRDGAFRETGEADEPAGDEPDASRAEATGD